jgi:hypothetical protein
MSTAGPPTVLLLHELPDGTSHVDWMIATEPQGREPLVTFRVDGRVDEMTDQQRLLARRIDDHRPAYLTYEGPVSGDRGTVRRLARGVVVSWDRSGDRWRMKIEWPGPQGPRCQDLRLSRREAGPDEWVIETLQTRTGPGW